MRERYAVPPPKRQRMGFKSRAAGRRLEVPLGREVTSQPPAPAWRGCGGPGPRGVAPAAAGLCPPGCCVPTASFAVCGPRSPFSPVTCWGCTKTSPRRRYWAARDRVPTLYFHSPWGDRRLFSSSFLRCSTRSTRCGRTRTWHCCSPCSWLQTTCATSLWCCCKASASSSPGSCCFTLKGCVPSSSSSSSMGWAPPQTLPTTPISTAWWMWICTARSPAIAAVPHWWATQWVLCVGSFLCP